MIKKLAMNKIIIIGMYIFLLLSFYLLPSNPNVKLKIQDKIEEENISSKVYLLDKDNYVSMVNITYNTKNIEDEIKYKIELLKNGINNDIFYPLIPKNTKLNSVKIEKDNVYLDFNDEINKISNHLSEKMIESIIYTITEIKEINNIYITVNGIELKEIGNIKLNYPLNRNYGINKKYDLNSLNNITKTTIYFEKNDNNNEYYVPLTLVSNNNDDKVDIIIKELKSSVNSQSNLNGYVSEDLNIIKYEILNDKMNIMFNNYIFSDNEKKVIEEVKYVISYSIFDNFNVNEVIFSTMDNSNIVSITR